MSAVSAPRPFQDWYREQAADVPWLIFGKGPTFSKRAQFPLERYRTLGLNHVLREQPVFLTHVIDIDVIEQCQDVLAANTRFLVMPWHPHEKKPLPIGPKLRVAPSEATLAQWCERLPALGQLAREGRLLWYNLHTAGPERRREGAPLIKAHGFSVTAAVRLLAGCGARTIRTLGIDGGDQYASEFGDLSGTTRLQSWQSDFDMQFEDIARAIVEHDLDFAPLALQSPVRVFVGTEPEQALAYEVLRHSIRRHASMTVDVQPLYRAIERAGIAIPVPQSRGNRARTPFSFQRFAIPRLAGYQGRAIYMDSDMQVFRDIRGLWSRPFDGAQVLAVAEPESSGRRPQFSVMLLDCAALDWDPVAIVGRLDRGELSYEQVVYEMRVADRIAATLPAEWNELERYREGRTALTHYTDMSRQPWLTTDNPLARYWCEALFEALDSGHLNRDLVAEEIARGNVRPSLLRQVDERIVDPLLLPQRLREAERAQFVPPHAVPGALRGTRRGFWQPLALRAYAGLRQLWLSPPARRAREFLKKLARNLR